MADWNTVLSDPRYIALDNEKKMSVAQKFFGDFYEKDERYTGLEQRKKDSIKKKFYATAAETMQPTVPEKGAIRTGLERIATVQAEEKSKAAEAGEPMFVAYPRAASKLAYEMVAGGDIQQRMTREEAEDALRAKEYAKYARGAAGNIAKGMASVPEILATAPISIVDALSRGAADITGAVPEGMDRAEVARETARSTAEELFGWIEEIVNDPIRAAFENPENVAFALEMAKGAVKGTTKGVDIVEGLKARRGAIQAVREGLAPVRPPRVPREARKPIAKPTPTKADIVPDPVTEGGFLKVPKVEDIAQTAQWARDNAKNAYRSIKEFFIPLSTIKNSELFLKQRYKHLGDMDRLESLTLKQHKALSDFGPDANHLIFKYLDGQYAPPVKNLPYGKVKIKLQKTGVRGLRRSLWVDISKLEEQVAKAKSEFKKRPGNHEARLIHNKLKKKLEKLKKSRDIAPTDIQRGSGYIDANHPEMALKNLHEALKGILPEAKANEAIRSARNIRRLSDKAWAGYLDRGLIDLNTYTKHKYDYVKYMYLKHIVGDKVSVPGTPSGKMDLSQLKARMDLTPEQRRAIGWVEDASIAGPVGVAQSWGDMLKYDYLQKISANPEWTWEPSTVNIQTNMVNRKGQRIKKRMAIHELAEEVDIAKRVSEKAPNNLEAKQYHKRLQKALDKVKTESGKAPKDYVQMPNDPRYGSLRGAYLRKPIAQDIMPIMSISKDTFGSKLVGGAIQANQKLMSAFKVGKVALNPPTIVRNVGSNVVQQNMSGVPLWEMPKHLGKALQHIYKKDAVWGQARRHGIFKTNWGQAEIGEILGDLKKLEKKPYPDLLAGLQKIAEQYGKVDDFFKMAKFAERVRKGDSYAKAAIEAQKWGMDYSLTSPAIKVARANIAPFVTYQYKILPLILETAKKRPWVFAKYAAIPWIATEALLEKEGITDEEWAELKRDLPLYLKNSGTAMPIPWKSPEGNVQWVNYEYFMPFGNAWQFATDIPNYGAVSPEGTGPGDFLRAVGIGNPIVDTVYGSLMMARGTDPPVDTFTKKPVYNRLDDPSTKLKKTMYWLYTKWAPGAFTKEGALGYTARIGEEDRYGRTITPEQGIGRWFGVNITAPTPEQGARYRAWYIGNLKRELRMIMKNPEISDDEKTAVQENFQLMMDELSK
jgi:hypothetical protein